MSEDRQIIEADPETMTLTIAYRVDGRMKKKKVQLCRLAIAKLRTAAALDTAEGCLWFAILEKAIEDAFTGPTRESAVIQESSKRSALRFLESRDVEPYCWLAGLDPEFVQRVIARCLEFMGETTQQVA